MKPIHLDCKTISDAHYQLVTNLFDNCYTQTIQQGSFENEQVRYQYAGASFYIEFPWMDMVPVIPPGLGLPAITTEENNQDYFANYIMDPVLAENETYKYSSRIYQPMPGNPMMGIEAIGTQMDRVLDLLKKTPYTNQANISISSPVDLDVCYGNDRKLDPPCLRGIGFKVIPAEDYFKDSTYIKHDARPVLTLSCYFRSWDLWAALPINLAGLEYLKQYFVSETNLQNGAMYCYSEGLHIYSYQKDIAKIRTYRK